MNDRQRRLQQSLQRLREQTERLQEQFNRARTLYQGNRTLLRELRVERATNSPIAPPHCP